jgi:hypothetical protein
MSDPNLPDTSGFTPFQPVYSNPRNGELVTLCQILEVLSGGGGVAENVNIVTNGSAVSSENPLPVIDETGFSIPAYNDVEFQYQNGAFPTQPTYITFKQNGNAVYYIYLQYDGNGALTRVAQD